MALPDRQDGNFKSIVEGFFKPQEEQVFVGKVGAEIRADLRRFKGPAAKLVEYCQENRLGRLIAALVKLPDSESDTNEQTYQSGFYALRFPNGIFKRKALLIPNDDSYDLRFVIPRVIPFVGGDDKIRKDLTYLDKFDSLFSPQDTDEPVILTNWKIDQNISLFESVKNRFDILPALLLTPEPTLKYDDLIKTAIEYAESLHKMRRDRDSYINFLAQDESFESLFKNTDTLWEDLTGIDIKHMKTQINFFGKHGVIYEEGMDIDKVV